MVSFLESYITALRQSRANFFALSVLPICVLLVVVKLYGILASPLRDVQGPLLARFSRIWLFTKVYQGVFHFDNVALHKKYGRIVRIAPNEYSIDDPASVQLIYGSRGGFIKGPWYRAGRPPSSVHPNVFTETNIEKHAFYRRKISGAYSMTNLVQLEPYIDSCTSIFRTRLDEFAASGEQIDVTHWMQCFAFEVVGSITVGSRFGFLDAGKDIEGIMNALDTTLKHAARVGIYSEWHSWLFSIEKFLGTQKNGMPHVVAFIAQTIGRRLEKGPPPAEKDEDGPADFITKFQRIQAENPEKLSRADIMGSCIANIGAGSDTTSISFTSVIYHLCNHPAVLKKLREEIDEGYKSGALTEPISFKQAQTLQYFQAVIKECLRCMPATGLVLQRVVPEGGATLAGRFFPAGTLVGISAWVAHANKDVFGADAETFRPERWLESSEVVKARDAYFMSFGSGPRTCLGKNISLLEISKVIPTLVRNYDFEPGALGQKLQTDNCWFIKPHGFKCRIRKRTVEGG
ncbi:cytochrome P450 [Leptodontidium sp. 2 PMI_412]|nr:cytochrome P450 [Leptodontidium sp. 2 PMI_412]